MLKVIFVILIIGFVSAVDVEMDCPKEVFVGEEFECSLEVFDGDGIYDLKIEVDTARNSSLRVLDGGEWKSGYFYLKEFIQDTENVLLKFSEKGRYDFVVKLRQGSNGCPMGFLCF